MYLRWPYQTQSKFLEYFLPLYYENRVQNSRDDFRVPIPPYKGSQSGIRDIGPNVGLKNPGFNFTKKPLLKIYAFTLPKYKKTELSYLHSKFVLTINIKENKLEAKVV